MVWQDPDDNPEPVRECYPWEVNDFEVPEDTAWKGPPDPNAWRDPPPRMSWQKTEPEPPPMFIERDSGPLYRMWKDLCEMLQELFRPLGPDVYDDEDMC